MSKLDRRTFLRASGLSAIPLLAPALPVIGKINSAPQHLADNRPVHFLGDGEFYEPAYYIKLLQQIDATQPIKRDTYGSGGAVEALEKKFAEITGKEKAIFMPSGTMANQFAIRVLTGEHTKVFVQETSHVFRDEADAAQSVHGKRLIPLAKGQTGFSVDELQQAVEYHQQGEVFASGMGAVSIENPVRRTAGKMIPIEELRKISDYCKKQNLKLHLDGARLYMAAAWSGKSIAEYAGLFDTVYISLYKYLGASSGAILCGSKSVIDKMPHLMKIHGGSMFGNWTNAAMALKHVEGAEKNWQEARKRAEELFRQLNELPQLKITSEPHGTNIYSLIYAQGTDSTKVANALFKDHNIRIGRPGNSGSMRLIVNETILYQETGVIYNAFRKALTAT